MAATTTRPCKLNTNNSSSSETILLSSVSILIFLLTVLMAFMLFRAGVKVYIERHHNKEGSRIRSKLLFGALVLTLAPALFYVLFSVYVLNRHLDVWFSKTSLQRLDSLYRNEAQERVEADLRGEAPRLVHTQEEALRVVDLREAEVREEVAGRVERPLGEPEDHVDAGEREPVARDDPQEAAPPEPVGRQRLATGQVRGHERAIEQEPRDEEEDRDPRVAVSEELPEATVDAVARGEPGVVVASIANEVNAALSKVPAGPSAVQL